MAALFKRRRNGSWRLALDDDERAALASLADQLDELMETEPEDPGLRRLFPTAYADEADAGLEAEWQVFRGHELRSARQAQLDVLRSSAGRTDFTEEEVLAWMQAVNAVRLVLGTRLDVGEDDEEFDPAAPDAAIHALYWFLGMLIERTVDSLGRP